VQPIDNYPLDTLSQLSVEQLRQLRGKLKGAPALPAVTAQQAPPAPAVTIVRNGIFAPRPRPQAQCRLLCLPFAGGGASTYVGWAPALESYLELVCIDPPGRGTRFGDAPIGDARRLAERLACDLAPWLDKPIALFGHSNGALVAFELARRLQQAGCAPLGFFASAKGAPSRLNERSTWHVMSDEQLLGAMRVAVRDKETLDQARDPEAVAMFLRALRADLSLSETYRPSPGEPLSSHLATFRGTEDIAMSEEDLEAWRTEFTGQVRHLDFPGGHFFIDDHPMQVIGAVNRSVGEWLRQI
jgi:medium-chain acyl-[acyl-carrier-protein] hydrolase